jgi:SAM-dependent methyltransferase
MTGLIRVRRVDDDGVALIALSDLPMDVRIDGRRVWTFWSRRDTAARGGSPRAVSRLAQWPAPMVRYLDGTARIEVAESASGRVHFDARVGLGGGEGPILVRNAAGQDLGFDKSGHLVPTFAGRSDADIADLLDATEAVLAALRSTGVEPFVAYGTLLGAVREGTVLGHDSDADLGYVSRHSHPVDVILESFRIQRQLAEQGWEISRYSGGAFKISVTEGDMTRGLDVFGGFMDHGRLHLMGEIGVDFRQEWIFPLTTATLHGREVPVPQRADKLLEVTYGQGWRVPDPAFQFATPSRTTRALNDWFRGNQPNIRFWHRQVGPNLRRELPKRSALAKLARDEARARGAEVLDVGAGRGADSLWLAGQGLRVTAYDYATGSLERAQAAAREQGSELSVRHLNLTDRRSALAEGMRLAHDPRPRVVLARHLLDATSYEGQQSLARLCSMALRRGGVLLAEFSPRDELAELGVDTEWMVSQVNEKRLVKLLTAAGAKDVQIERLTGRPRPVVRVRGEW